MDIMLQSFNRLFTNGTKVDEQNADQVDVVQLNVSDIDPNAYQPRTEFDEEKIKELAQTLQTHGIIQPIIVRSKGEDQYEIIAGERRLRAAKLLEWEKISAIIRELSDTETASHALIENIQREELSAIEAAQAYSMLIEMHELTQEALAQRLGKCQSTVANRLRLLSLPDDIQDGLLHKKITERHARSLMTLKTTEEQVEYYEKVIEQGLTVRELDRKSTRLNSSHVSSSYAVFCLKK